MKIKYKISFHALIVLVMIGGISCTPKSDADHLEDDNVLLTVNGKALFKSDLLDIIPSGIAAQDSAETAEAYIKLWINDALMYEKAQQNIANKERIEELVNNYRQSLTVFTYQEQLLKERFSNQLSDNVLKEYYDKNSEKFKLRSNLIKGLFLKIPSNSDMANDFRKWYKAGTQEALEGIEKNHIKNAIAYDFFYDRWVNFDEILLKIPYTITNSEDFLRKNKSLEVDDSTNVYLLHIKECVLTGSVAPFEYVKPQVAEMLLNQRKTEYLDKFQQDLYNDAIAKNKITFYYKKDSKNKTSE